jgi:hypothetical protein
VAMYMTIPEVTEAEDLLSVQNDADGKSFVVTTAITATTTELMQIAAEGRMLPLVVLVTDPMMLALDNVYIASANMSGGGPDPIASFELQAEAVRPV